MTTDEDIHECIGATIVSPIVLLFICYIYYTNVVIDYNLFNCNILLDILCQLYVRYTSVRAHHQNSHRWSPLDCHQTDSAITFPLLYSHLDY